MSKPTEVKLTCRLGGLPPNTSSEGLLRRGIPASTVTLHAVGECRLRPRQHGGTPALECFDPTDCPMLRPAV